MSKTFTITLSNYIDSKLAFGSANGRKAYKLINDEIQNIDCDIVKVSLSHLDAVDATFMRDSIFALARNFHLSKVFYLVDLPNNRISSNLTYASRVTEQPMLAVIEGETYWIGNLNRKSQNDVLTYIESVNSVKSNDIAKLFNIELPAASSRLKKLYDEGYIFRTKKNNDSGGVEYSYFSVRNYILGSCNHNAVSG